MKEKWGGRTNVLLEELGFLLHGILEMAGIRDRFGDGEGIGLCHCVEAGSAHEIEAPSDFGRAEDVIPKPIFNREIGLGKHSAASVSRVARQGELKL